MKKVMLAVLVFSVAACGTDPVSAPADPSPGPAVTECGLPPDAPGYAVEDGSDVTCMETAQFEGLQAWVAAESDWRECVVTGGRVRVGL